MTILDDTGHLGDETLVQRACNQLTAGEEAELVAHLEQCTSCADLWRAIESMRAAAVEFDPGAIAPAEPRFGSGRWRPVLGALAAAGVLAASLVLWVGRGDDLVTSTPVVVVRSGPTSAPEPLSPAEGARVRRPGFSWRPVAAADRYTVELFDHRGEPIWTSEETPGPRIGWPDTVASSPGQYFWRVKAHFEDGADAADSPLVSFYLTAE